MALFRKNTLAEPFENFVAALISLLTQKEGQTMPLCSLNELARSQGIYTYAYFGTLGFQADNLKPAQELLVAKDTSGLKSISQKEWQAEFSVSSPEKSLLSPYLSSKDRYFNLYVTPTNFESATKLAQAVLPETKVYQKDDAGAFVLDTLKELLYCTYRLDLALHPKLEENHLPEEKIAPALTLPPVRNLLLDIQNQRISELDNQYLFTWLLQYSATITATSTLYASYSQADLPPEVLEKTAPLVKKLVEEITSVPQTLATNATDSLQISAQLLDQIPELFAEAQGKMAALNAKLTGADKGDS